MAVTFATKGRKTRLISIFLLISFTIVHVSGFEYVVGGDKGKGWVKPDGSESETYNEWAEQHRFHIADTIRFEYRKDSVLVVDSEDYGNCNGTRPVFKFDDGNTVFEFDRSGFFFFISGKPGHCEAGQKMIIRVMVQSGVQLPPPMSPSSSPSPSPSPFAQGPDTPVLGPGLGLSPAVNSTVMLTVTSYLMTLFMGVVIVLYLF